jgi:hypothetical protein
MNDEIELKPTRQLLARCKSEWMRIAQEPIDVTAIGTAIVGKGIELAVLRLEHEYRRTPQARAHYSRILGSWVFLLDIGHPMPWRFAAPTSSVRLTVLPDQGSHGDFLCIQQEVDSDVWARTPGTTRLDRSRADRLAHLHNTHEELIDMLEQARAALPDAWFAEKASVPRSLLEALDVIIEKAKR